MSSVPHVPRSPTLFPGLWQVARTSAPPLTALAMHVPTVLPLLLDYARGGQWHLPGAGVSTSSRDTSHTTFGMPSLVPSVNTCRL